MGGLPEEMNLKIVEPLRSLFKDEVRRVGRALGIKNSLISRHPFPGGEGFLTLYDCIWQAGTILPPVRSVGVMGDERTYEYTIALRAVVSTDGMTADWVHLPYDFLAKVSNDIINKVRGVNRRGVNRVVYDISSKPPATIEWE